MASKDHHFIPQMHLSRFSPNGKTFVYDKQWGALRHPKAPKGQAYEEHLYTFTQEGGRRTSVIEDEVLSSIDSLAAVELAALHQTASPKSLPALAQYIASLVVRNPKAIEVNRLQGSAMLEEVFPRMLNDREFRARLRKRCKDEADFQGLMKAAATAQVSMHRDFAMTTQLSLLTRVPRALLDGDWQLLIAGGWEEFVLADSPVFTCDPHSSMRSVAALSRPSNETTVPLSPQFCLLIDGGSRGGFSRRFVGDEVVREVNRRSAYSAHRRFFASHFRESWEELVREFPPMDVSAEIRRFKNGLAFIPMVDNQLFQPIA